MNPGKISLLLSGLLLVCHTATQAQSTILSSGHTDLSLNYDRTNNAWDLHVGSDTTGLEYAASNTVLQTKSAALTTVPTNASFGFLGAAGAPVWILPQTQNEEILYLGYGGDGIPLGVFVDDQVTITLQNVSGPGGFFSYKTDTFGTPVVYFNTHDGVSTNDRVTVQAGGDFHLNWAFTRAGTYKVVLQASGTLINGNQVTTSAPVTYTFQVVTPSILSTGHTDLALDYDDTSNTWNAHAGSDTFGTEYAANEVFLEVKAAALTPVPTNASFNFLGAAGTPVWILPQTQNEDLLYLGYGGDGIPLGVFVNEQVTVTLLAVSGPGDFFSYKTDTFGNPVVYFNTHGGVSTNDHVIVQAGGDFHLNWAFTAPGIYTVTLAASGTLMNGGQFTSSGPVTYFFEVLGPTILSSGHTDLSLNYSSTNNLWDLHVGSDTTGLEYGANEVILQANAESKTNVPSGSSFGFLGNPGDPIWILPQTQNEDLLYLGYGGDGLSLGDFAGDQVKVALKSVTGPGDFFSYKTDTFGNPVVYFNTRDGIDSNDVATVQAGGDFHLNWAFTAVGTYKIALEASGILAAGNVGTTSAPVTFTFFVLPASADLTNEHVDLRMEYAPASSNIFYMVASDEDHHIHYASNEVNLVLETNSQITLPGDFPPLGNAGDPIWVVPQSQDPTLLYLGISAEDVPLGVFNGNLTFQLKVMDGPGDFFLWQADSGGNLSYYMNTRDGITTSDATQPLIPSHSHYNWGFTTNGVYHLTFQASGQRLGEATNIFTPLTTFTFNVLPLPAPTAPTPFQVWQAIYWPGGTSDFIKGPDADPDGDGIVNLLEYALALDPNTPDTSGLPTFSFVTDTGSQYGALSYTHVKSAIDLDYTVVATSDLSSGVWAALTTVVSTVDQGATDLVTVRDSLLSNSAPVRFYQLRVNLR